MPRQTITAVAVTSKYPADKVTIAEVAADASNFEKMILTGREILIAHNTNAGSTARTVTITSVADAEGRTGDITATSIAAGAFAMFGPFALDGWKQSDGYLYFQASHAEIKYMAILM